MIVIGNPQVSEEIIDLAKERDCSILSTPYDALQAARLIYQTPSIDNVMGLDVMVFHDREFVDDVSLSLIHISLCSLNTNILAAI